MYLYPLCAHERQSLACKMKTPWKHHENHSYLNVLIQDYTMYIIAYLRFPFYVYIHYIHWPCIDLLSINIQYILSKAYDRLDPYPVLSLIILKIFTYMYNLFSKTFNVTFAIVHYFNGVQVIVEIDVIVNVNFQCYV